MLDSAFVSLGYVGTFLAGMFLAYGFTAAPAVALFMIIADNQNIFLATLIGSLGTMLADYTIFMFIRTSFDDEIRRIEKSKLVCEIDHDIPARMRHYLNIIFAEFFLASPLPDEIGVSLLAMDKHLSKKVFAAISFTLHLLGIFIILFIGQTVL